MVIWTIRNISSKFEHLVFADLRESDAETSLMYFCIIAYHRTTMRCRAASRQDRNQKQTSWTGLHGDGIYVTISWTSDDCDGQVYFELHLSVTDK